jgi:hypothetical protein
MPERALKFHKAVRANDRAMDLKPADLEDLRKLIERTGTQLA